MENLLRNFKLIKKHIDVKPFLIEVAKNEACWSSKRARSISLHRETLSIFLRTGIYEDGKELMDCHLSEKTPHYALFPTITSWLENFAKEIEGELSIVLIISLKGGGKVYPHLDFGEYYRIRDRYHLVLQSKKGTRFVAGDEEQMMNEGELWWFDNKKRHEVYNESFSSRIHVVFDILPASMSKTPPSS